MSEIGGKMNFLSPNYNNKNVLDLGVAKGWVVQYVLVAKVWTILVTRRGPHRGCALTFWIAKEWIVGHVVGRRAKYHIKGFALTKW